MSRLSHYLRNINIHLRTQKTLFQVSKSPKNLEKTFSTQGIFHWIGATSDALFFMDFTLPTLPPEVWTIVLSHDTRESQLDLVCKEWRNIMFESRCDIPNGVIVIPNLILWLVNHVMPNDTTIEFDTSMLKENSRTYIQRDVFMSCIGSVAERHPDFLMRHYSNGKLRFNSVSKKVCVEFMNARSRLIVASFSSPFTIR